MTKQTSCECTEQRLRSTHVSAQSNRAPKVITLFSSATTEHEISTKIPTNEEVSCFKYLRCCIYHANNVKMPTIVGILTFMSRINFVLS